MSRAGAVSSAEELQLLRQDADERDLCRAERGADGERGAERGADHEVTEPYGFAAGPRAQRLRGPSLAALGLALCALALVCCGRGQPGPSSVALDFQAENEAGPAGPPCLPPESGMAYDTAKLYATVWYIPSHEDCERICLQNWGCSAWVWGHFNNHDMCWLKKLHHGEAVNKRQAEDRISGQCRTGLPWPRAANSSAASAALLRRP